MMHGNPRGPLSELQQVREQVRQQKEAKKRTVSVKPDASVKLSLRAAMFLPGRDFTFENQLDMDVRIVVDGRDIRLEKG